MAMTCSSRAGCGGLKRPPMQAGPLGDPPLMFTATYHALSIRIGTARSQVASGLPFFGRNVDTVGVYLGRVGLNYRIREPAVDVCKPIPQSSTSFSVSCTRCDTPATLEPPDWN